MTANSVIQMLETENARLRAEVEDLRRLLAGGYEPPVGWGLVNAEVRVLRALISRAIASKEMLYEALYHDSDEEPALATVESHVSKLRRKIEPHGISIINERFRGYRLDEAGRQRLSGLVLA
ncbi:MAG: helix-turn-helix domain-containing protein [Bradyrhizobium sp.]|uniref:helix-turn-helix domain-containing protein n=1 Tax=Bradyrhizobium sp. TaxID=376 RepID=UPI003D0E9A05